MKKGLIRKGLVFSIIVLFIGVGIQPAFATESITTIADSEDCKDCQVSEEYSLLKVNLMLTRLGVIVNFVSYRFGDIAKVKENCQKIIDVINLFSLTDNETICNIIYTIMTPVDSLIDSFSDTYKYLENISYFLATMFKLTVVYPIIGVFAVIWRIGVFFDCW
jgi:hypothetical protein